MDNLPSHWTSAIGNIGNDLQGMKTNGAAPDARVEEGDALVLNLALDLKHAWADGPHCML